MCFEVQEYNVFKKMRVFTLTERFNVKCDLHFDYTFADQNFI